MTPEDFIQVYEKKSASHRFDEVDPLIADDAVFWFNDGSFSGKDSIRKAFDRTSTFEIQDERYWLDNLRWLVKAEGFAVCIFSYHWTGVVEGVFKNLGDGRGTCVLRAFESGWKISHEHLSREPILLS
ncbi:MAG TPA: nuclear transport factor 2 family protein [Nitrososphaerales archaeon]|nr:nuclear transport factor 2 family protein [Nitrososphaerales archaeon]